MSADEDGLSAADFALKRSGKRTDIVNYLDVEDPLSEDGTGTHKDKSPMSIERFDQSISLNDIQESDKESIDLSIDERFGDERIDFMMTDEER